MSLTNIVGGPTPPIREEFDREIEGPIPFPMEDMEIPIPEFETRTEMAPELVVPSIAEVYRNMIEKL